jgi:hypothetical protein
MYVLSDWRIVVARNAPEADGLCVSGYVSGNPRFAEGELVTTSVIRTYRLESEAVVVITRKGSEYRLGKPGSAEPFAAQRLLRHLAERSAEAGRNRDTDIQTRAPRLDEADLEDFFSADRNSSAS